MKSLGLILLFYGIGSIVLGIFGYEFVVMDWIDNWGPEMAWLIIKAIIGLGLVFFVLGLFFDKKIMAAAGD